MILTFSVPEKYVQIINWYKSLEGQEKSREFRKVILEYLENEPHIMKVNEAERFSRPQANVAKPLQKVNIVTSTQEDDLDSKLDLMGLGVIGIDQQTGNAASM